MGKKPHFSKSILAVSVAVLLMLTVLLAVFFENRARKEKKAIVLPDPPQEVSVPEKTEETSPDGFVQISRDNVLSVLQNIHKPSSYHQVYHVTVGSDLAQAVHRVELWVNGDLLRAEVSDDVQTKNILTDGSTLYLWYNDEEQAASVALRESAVVENLLGLLSYDNLLTLEPEQITDADFLVLEDPTLPCLYVCSRDAVYVASRFWIDLETGLLYKADILEQSRQVYTLLQENLELLAEEDEAFRDRFCLPDGTVPFSKTEEMPQP